MILQILDAAGVVLPEGLRFFTIGWWVVHLLGIALVFAWGFRRGRQHERRERGRSQNQTR